MDSSKSVLPAPVLQTRDSITPDRHEPESITVITSEDDVQRDRSKVQVVVGKSEYSTIKDREKEFISVVQTAEVDSVRDPKLPVPISTKTACPEVLARDPR